MGLSSTFLDPILNNVSQVITRNISGVISENTIRVIPNTTFTVCRNELQNISLNSTNLTNWSALNRTGINGKVNRRICETKYFNRTYTVYDMDWECYTPNSTNVTKKTIYGHYLRSCKEEHCIAVQSVCEFPGNFLYAMCLCDASCGPNNEFKTGRCVAPPIGGPNISNEILFIYYGNGSTTNKKYVSHAQISTQSLGISPLFQIV